MKMVASNVLKLQRSGHARLKACKDMLDSQSVKLEKTIDALKGDDEDDVASVKEWRVRERIQEHRDNPGLNDKLVELMRRVMEATVTSPLLHLTACVLTGCFACIDWKLCMH